MSRKRLAQDVEVEEYFAKLRGNLVFAELAAVQLTVIAKRLEKREVLAGDLRVNLEVQEQALRDMLVLSIARLFDTEGRRQDQLSIPNILGSRKITLSHDHKDTIRKLISHKSIKEIKGIRDSIVAHSLSHASDKFLQGSDIMEIINSCYDVIADIYNFNRPLERLDRQDTSIYLNKWSEMTKSWY